MSVFFLFLLATSLGALSTLYWIPEENLGRGYFQMNALVVLGLLSLAAAVELIHPFRPFGERPAAGVTALAAALVGGFLYYAAIWRQRWDLCRWPLTLALAGCATALLPARPHLVRPLSPLAVAGSALQCARQRSNQSGTGILYVLVVGAFIGEITGAYLSVTTGVPV